MTDVSIGIDLGGTRIKAVAIDKSGNIINQYFHSTSDNEDMGWKDAVNQAMHEIQKKIESQNTVVGISAPGLPNANNSVIAFMPGRLQGLENFNWSGFLGTRTFVLNDAVSALMAEARFGVAKDRKNVAFLLKGNHTRVLLTKPGTSDIWSLTAMELRI